MESDPSTSQPEGHIPTHSTTTRSDLHCCCGREECAFLQHNHDALGGLEKDLETAARLGQALLHRHESYMAEAEADRQRLLASIEVLERDKRLVEAENARIVEENRNLLDELEGLNKAVADSDAHAKSLTAALEGSEAELRNLTAAAARAADLEAQLTHMEVEQSRLHESLSVAEEDSRSAIDRWKKAECTLQNLNDQIDRIEKEAKEERERHAELVERMERRRTVERELEGAAGRLKGAVAAQNIGRGGTTLVSRFVKDILQDNANLQLGIVELREMLESSNQEVQNLRDQIVSHHPLAPAAEGERPATTLSQELSANESRRVSQEFHIHHHYHTPPVAAKKEKSSLFRRSNKRRSLGNPPLSAISNSQGPRKLKKHRPQTSMSSASTILSQTSVSIPPPGSQGWPVQSPVPPDSMASSPQSAYRSSGSIFDRVERGFDSSQPTSPDSAIFTSPLRNGRWKSGGPSDAYRTLDGADGGPLSDDDFSEFQLQSVIPEENEDGISISRAQSPVADDDVFSTSTSYRGFRRAASHESLFSVAGMDIHTPSHRPSRMSGYISGGLPLQVQRRIMSSDFASTPPTTSNINVIAGKEPAKPTSSHQSPQSLLASVAGPRQPQPQAQAQDQPQADNSTSLPSSLDDSALTPNKILTLGHRVGGWVRGRWGTAAVSHSHTPSRPVSRRSLSRSLKVVSEEPSPVQSCASSTHSNVENQPRPQSQQGSVMARSVSYPGPQAQAQAPAPVPAPVQTPKRPPLRFRYPGVNQKGPIMGFRPAPPAPTSVHAERLDEGLLRESLAE
ncbi:uncharacterized protein BDV17DRAFT_258922 [Aspergillus undulatus]|uniref:uncharacterized protein n=1 Tax=Aspergillus undulatus TaxID=1810928 RepID=UPI003CCD0616